MRIIDLIGNDRTISILAI